MQNRQELERVPFSFFKHSEKMLEVSSNNNMNSTNIFYQFLTILFIALMLYCINFFLTNWLGQLDNSLYEITKSNALIENIFGEIISIIFITIFWFSCSLSLLFPSIFLYKYNFTFKKNNAIE